MTNLPRRLAMCFGQFGPYHHARLLALQRVAAESGSIVLPVQVGAQSGIYEWETSGLPHCEGLRTLFEGRIEEYPAIRVFLAARRLFREENIELVFVSSYWPAPILALFMAAKSLGLTTVIMGDSHAGTERVTGWRKWAKSRIVKSADAAFVAGKPHIRYFESLGLSPDRIFTGFDAIDNTFFARNATRARTSRSRFRYHLPARYFLSLGRMIEKKNLETLIAAYAVYVGRAVTAGAEPLALVLVGSGEREEVLRSQAETLGLPVIDCTELRPIADSADYRDGDAARPQGDSSLRTGAAVYFYGFRQISETPVFYAHADAFVLPSIREEWGLVVNEAMACSLPVIVSRTAGCAEDLLPRAEYRACPERRLNGFLFDPYSTDALAAVLERVANLGTGAGDKLADLGEKSSEIAKGFDCENFAFQAVRAASIAFGQ